MGVTRTETVVCVICGVGALLSIIVGYAWPSTGASVLKDFMVFFGGAGIAYALANASARAATVDARAAEDQRIKSLCKRSVQRLGLTAYHARDASTTLRDQASSGLRPETADLIADMLEHMAEEAQVSIGDWEEVAKEKLGLDALVGKSLETITQAVAQVSAEEPEKQKLLSAVSQVRQFLELTSSTPGTGRRLAPITVACVQCGKEIQSLLGDAAGETTQMKCPQCGASFSVHRLLSGGVRVGRVTTNKVTCPLCNKQELRVELRPGDSGSLVRNCFNCDARVVINASTGAVVKAEKQTPLKASYRTGPNGERVIKCPSCGKDLEARSAYRGDVFKLTCSGCMSLIAAIAESEPARDEKPMPVPAAG